MVAHARDPRTCLETLEISRYVRTSGASDTERANLYIKHIGLCRTHAACHKVLTLHASTILGDPADKIAG